MKSKIRQQGFTLIEIVVLLLILAIVAVVAVPKYLAAQREAEKKSLYSVLSDMRSRADSAFIISIMKNNGEGISSEYDDWNDLGFASTAEVAAAYPEFTGSWDLSSGVVITYKMKHASSAAVIFTMGGMTSSSPPKIITNQVL